jgi:hypothetical protein
MGARCGSYFFLDPQPVRENRTKTSYGVLKRNPSPSPRGGEMKEETPTTLSGPRPLKYLIKASVGSSF